MFSYGKDLYVRLWKRSRRDRFSYGEDLVEICSAMKMYCRGFSKATVAVVCAPLIAFGENGLGRSSQGVILLRVSRYIRRTCEICLHRRCAYVRGGRGVCEREGQYHLRQGTKNVRRSRSCRRQGWSTRVQGRLIQHTRTIWDGVVYGDCLLYTSPSPRDRQKSRMPSSA